MHGACSLVSTRGVSHMAIQGTTVVPGHSLLTHWSVGTHVHWQCERSLEQRFTCEVLPAEPVPSGMYIVWMESTNSATMGCAKVKFAFTTSSMITTGLDSDMRCRLSLVMPSRAARSLTCAHKATTSQAGYAAVNARAI